jgi:hypothetical protein
MAETKVKHTPNLRKLKENKLNDTLRQEIGRMIKLEVRNRLRTFIFWSSSRTRKKDPCPDYKR